VRLMEFANAGSRCKQDRRPYRYLTQQDARSCQHGGRASETPHVTTNYALRTFSYSILRRHGTYVVSLKRLSHNTAASGITWAFYKLSLEDG
jgi:hypothetical protein